VCRSNCETCSVLQDYYRLVINDAVVAAQTANFSDTVIVVIDEDLREAVERMLRAGRALLAHWQSCEARRVSQVV
jgi:hypothetical protein